MAVDDAEETLLTLHLTISQEEYLEDHVAVASFEGIFQAAVSIGAATVGPKVRNILDSAVEAGWLYV